MQASVPRPEERGIAERLGVDSRARPRIYEQVLDASDIGHLNYWLELTIACGIATLGLVLNSPAVVIGAMLISPLMGPILGAGLALAAGDLYLGLKSAVNLALSISGAIFFSAGLVWLLPFHSPTGEILARTTPNLLDLGVALLSGLAGSLVVCRGGGGGGVTALPGVAIAVALMPPLCTVGFGVGSGFLWPIVYGAGLLFLTNLAAIVAMAFLVFLSVRMGARQVRQEIDRLVSERAAADPLFRRIQGTRLAQSFGHIGNLRWRALMMIVVLGGLFVPLRAGFVQVRDEAIARNAVTDVVRQLAPADTLVTRQVDVAADRVTVRLVVTAPVDPARIHQAEVDLARRTGKSAVVSVRKVAGDEELALLRERLRAPAPPAAPDIASLRPELVSMLDRPLREAWPHAQATLVDYELGFTPSGTVVHVRYDADEPVGEAVREMLTNVLRNHLDAPELAVAMEHNNPRPEPAAGRRRR